MRPRRKPYNNATVGVPSRGTTMQARDRQWIGWYGETTGIVPGPGNGAFAVRIDPNGSQGFTNRFSLAWQSWRMVGWKVTVNIKAKSSADAQLFPNAMNPVAPFEVPNLTSSPGLPVPNTIESFTEVPNCKFMSVFPGSPHCRKTFSWRAKDLNFLPFQNFANLNTALSQTGIWGFVDMSDYQEVLDIQIMGRICIEFKDANIYVINAAMPPAGKDDKDKTPDMEFLHVTSPRPGSAQPARRLR